MAWVTTGWRRSLQVRIWKTEANPNISGFPSTGMTKTINGQTGFTYNGVTYPPLTNTQLAQLPLIGVTQTDNWTSVLNGFKLWARQEVSFDTSYEDAILSDDFFNRARLAPNAILWIGREYVGTGTTFTIELFDDNSVTPQPLNAIETIRIKLDYCSDEKPYISTKYFYILKGTNKTDIVLSEAFSDGDYGITRLADFSSTEIIEVKNVTGTIIQNYTNTAQGTEIPDQYVYYQYNDLTGD